MIIAATLLVPPFCDYVLAVDGSHRMPLALSVFFTLSWISMILRSDSITFAFTPYCISSIFRKLLMTARIVSVDLLGG